MGAKIRQMLSQAQAKIQTISIAKKSMRYIWWYAVTLIFAVTAYLIGWVYEWIHTGKPDLTELRNFIATIASSPWVAAIGFVAQMLVDKDKDGISDSIESKEDKQK